MALKSFTRVWFSFGSKLKILWRILSQGTLNSDTCLTVFEDLCAMRTINRLYLAQCEGSCTATDLNFELDDYNLQTQTCLYKLFSCENGWSILDVYCDLSIGYINYNPIFISEGALFIKMQIRKWLYYTQEESNLTYIRPMFSNWRNWGPLNLNRISIRFLFII